MIQWLLQGAACCLAPLVVAEHKHVLAAAVYSYHAADREGVGKLPHVIQIETAVYSRTVYAQG